MSGNYLPMRVPKSGFAKPILALLSAQTLKYRGDYLTWQNEGDSDTAYDQFVEVDRNILMPKRYSKHNTDVYTGEIPITLAAVDNRYRPDYLVAGSFSLEHAPFWLGKSVFITAIVVIVVVTPKRYKRASSRGMGMGGGKLSDEADALSKKDKKKQKKKDKKRGQTTTLNGEKRKAAVSAARQGKGAAPEVAQSGGKVLRYIQSQKELSKWRIVRFTFRKVVFLHEFFIGQEHDYLSIYRNVLQWSSFAGFIFLFVGIVTYVIAGTDINAEMEVLSASDMGTQ
ncbi:hypothetical protein KIPB_009545, partial [Kipferlia bialata]|eukprot:g9545.t1